LADGADEGSTGARQRGGELHLAARHPDDADGVDRLAAVGTPGRQFEGVFSDVLPVAEHFLGIGLDLLQVRQHVGIVWVVGCHVSDYRADWSAAIRHNYRVKTLKRLAFSTVILLSATAATAQTPAPD